QDLASNQSRPSRSRDRPPRRAHPWTPAGAREPDRYPGLLPSRWRLGRRISAHPCSSPSADDRAQLGGGWFLASIIVTHGPPDGGLLRALEILLEELDHHPPLFVVDVLGKLSFDLERLDTTPEDD